MLEKLKTIKGLKEAEDLLSIFMANEKSRYKNARDNGHFCSVDTLNRLCRLWYQPEVLPFKKDKEWIKKYEYKHNKKWDGNKNE